MARTPFHAVLRADLLARRFTIDQQLSESTLTAQYGVSRTPVREALSRLEEEGLIVRSLRGYRVRSGTPHDVIEIYDVRIALEQAAAEAAASRASELQLARLGQLHEYALAESDAIITRQLNAQWHDVLWEASQNVTLRETVTALIARLRLHDGSTTSRDDLADDLREHGEILAALRDRDGEAARSAMAAHLRRTKQERLAAFARPDRAG